MGRARGIQRAPARRLAGAELREPGDFRGAVETRDPGVPSIGYDVEWLGRSTQRLNLVSAQVVSGDSVLGQVVRPDGARRHVNQLRLSPELSDRNDLSARIDTNEAVRNDVRGRAGRAGYDGC